MGVQIGSIQSHIRQTHSDMLKIADLKRRGVLSADICKVLENAEQYWVKQRKSKTNILQWWLGWSNHRQLLKIFRETRMGNRRIQICEAATVRKTEESDDATDAQHLEENDEESDWDASDVDEEIDDDEDFDD